MEPCDRCLSRRALPGGLCYSCMKIAAEQEWLHQQAERQWEEHLAREEAIFRDEGRTLDHVYRHPED